MQIQRRLIGIGLVLAFVAACTPPPTIVTEPGKRAFSADQVLQRVEELQNFTIATYRAGNVDRQVAEAINFALEQINEFADIETANWRANVIRAWGNAKDSIPALTQGRFAPYSAAIDALLLGGDQ